MNNSKSPFCEYRIRNCTIPGRFFLAPVNTGLVTKGQPTEALMRFHEQRSGRGIAISYVGNVAIHHDYTTSGATAYISEKELWRELSNRIRQAGSIAGMQLACQKSSGAPPRKWKNSELHSLVQREREMICSMPELELGNIVQSFSEKAMEAFELGYEVIQIHAAHGYLLAKLLNPNINCRSDQYGNNWLAITKIIEQICSNQSRPIIDVRLSLCDGIEDVDTESGRTCELAEHLIQIGADMISFSSGMYDVNRFHIYPRPEDGHGCYIPLVEKLALKWPDKVWNAAGNIWDIDLLPLQVPNLTYAICRALIADPQFVEKYISGRSEEVRQCVRSGHCHYFSRGIKHIECKVNLEFAKYSELLS